MGIILTNALLCDIDPPKVELGCLRIEGGLIAERGGNLNARPGDEVVDCGGAVVLPGMVNGHTHLYSALAVGMPAPPKAPRTFYEILKFVWWRLDQALDAESIEMSARIGALEAIHCGTTTLFDHHASPNCIAGSLDLIDKGLAEVGPRGVLCYETTDRHGRAGREAGLAENRRYLKKDFTRSDGRFAGLVGAHASFTLDDGALDAIADMAFEFESQVHIHVAEDLCDEADARQRGAASLIHRLADKGLLHRSFIFGHGTHLDRAAVEMVNKAGVTMAHNPRSNMNNFVGYAPVASFNNVMLGTDGIGADMFAEVRAAWFISRHQQAGLLPEAIIDMLAASARRASVSLGVTLGRLGVGAAADVVLTDHVPFTPIQSENLAAHFLFSLSSRHVRDVMVGGRWVMRDRRVLTSDEAAIRREGSEVAERLWQRMAQIPCD
jgi:putative selenium metabolism protein SsnA